MNNIKNMTNRIKKSLKEEKEDNNILNDEISILFHDLKMPISNIIATYACLKKIFDRFAQYIPPEAPELEKLTFILDVLKKSSTKLDKMLTSFIENQMNKNLNFSKNNLKEMLSGMTELYQNTYSYGTRTYELHYSIKDEFFIYDKDKISNVFDNLLSNATKYTEQGMVIIEVTKNEEYVSIAIKDSGIGIDKEDLPHFFKLGYQGKNHTQKDSFGIGLYNVKNIIEQHGGTIEISSRVNRGTIIRINLPLNPKKN